MEIIEIINKLPGVLRRDFILPVREVFTFCRSSDPKTFSKCFHTGFFTFLILPTLEPIVASGIQWVDTNTVISGYEPAWITAISKDVRLAIGTSRTHVIWPCDAIKPLRRDPCTQFDSYWSHVLASPTIAGLLSQRKKEWLQSLRIMSLD